MWRARSDGDDRPLHNDDNRSGSGGVSPSGSADDRTIDDPRSEPTGRKIRRIESGPPGLGAERNRPGPASGPSLARRRPGGQNGHAGQGASTGPSGSNGRTGSGVEDQRAGRAGSAARRGRHVGRPDGDSASNGGVFGTVATPGGGASTGGLPPLRQPTGENPVVDGVGDAETPGAKTPASDSGASSDDAGGWPTDLPVKGVFGADDGDIDLTAPASDPLDDLAGEADLAIDDATIPSALSAAGSAGAAGRAASAAAAGLADDARGVANRATDLGQGLGDSARAGAGGLADGARSAASDATAAMPSAFPDTDGRPGDNSFPSWTAAKSDAPSSIDETLAMGPMAGGRGSRTAGRSGQGAGDRRPAPGGQSAGLGSRAGGSQRLQETEIKLAGRQSAPEKPREPNRVLLGLALAFVVLAGAAVAWWLTRDAGTDGDAAGEQEQLAETTTTLAAGDAAAPEPDAPAVEEPVLDVPTLSLLDVEPGPLDSETTYSLDLFGEPQGAMLQVVVDDVPQGQPDVLLPDLILPPGRHTLVVNVTDAAGTRLSSPIEVYVLDAPPALGTLANLASIDMVNEGWDEAIRRFDEYRAAGHQNLRLLPITPGFWNIFVPDQADAAAVATYCEGFGLVVPEDCFAKDFDPATYQGPTPAAAPAAGDGTDTADDGSMTDTDDGAMTDEGGADTSTSTTTGG